MTTYYVTKYALSTKGGKPIVVQSEDQPNEDDRITVKLSGFIWQTSFKLGRDIFRTRAEADKAILVARDKKIASLKKQIAKLQMIGAST